MKRLRYRFLECQTGLTNINRLGHTTARDADPACEGESIQVCSATSKQPTMLANVLWGNAIHMISDFTRSPDIPHSRATSGALPMSSIFLGQHTIANRYFPLVSPVDYITWGSPVSARYTSDACLLMLTEKGTRQLSNRLPSVSTLARDGLL